MPRAVAVFLILAPIVIGANAAFAPPGDFPAEGATLVVEPGASVGETAAMLAGARVIRNPEFFKFVVRVLGQDSGLQAGPYLFKTPESLLSVAKRLFTGVHGIPPVRITFPEGETVREMAERIANAFPKISFPEFLAAAKPYEGHLFPDTYFFDSWVNAEFIIVAMRKNFDAKITPFASDITQSGRTLSDLVILASLVEKEARSSEVRRMVAGILSNRLTRGMPLQVDAVFGYIFNRDTYSPSFEDLKVDSPYNTYIHTGLPPGPINNPGLDAIEAVFNPTKTDYLYYLTGTDGQMYYARTYAEHQSNQRKYLK